MYSALKFQGHKLYELARQGIEVERAARPVTIKSLHVNEIHLHDDEKTVTLTVECSKGTYIRTLCEDIGKKLGCGACMKQLVRTRVGSFGIDDSLTLAQIEELVNAGRINEVVTDIDEMFYQYRKLTVLEEYHKMLYNGNAFPAEAVGNLDEIELPYGEGERYRVYDAKDRFIAVYACEGDRFIPVKMFFTESSFEK
jgi:tRNA pseudouridine55 synthase